MSIERVVRDSGVVWRVRWRHAGHNHSKVLGRKRDAEAFDAEIRRVLRTLGARLAAKNASRCSAPGEGRRAADSRAADRARRLPAR